LTAWGIIGGQREGSAIAVVPTLPERQMPKRQVPEPRPLTNEQRRIVEWGDGPAVVIAGAGTGKTRVIVERVAHLLRTQDDLAPEHSWS
jgi:hypothetical protein